MNPNFLAAIPSIVVLAAASLGSVGCAATREPPVRAPVLAFAATDVAPADGTAFDGAGPAATGGVFGGAAACVIAGPARITDPQVRFARFENTEPRPLVAEIDAHRRLVVWTEGSLETGYHLRARTVGERGETLGDPLDLGNEGSALGQPSLTVDASGDAILTFTESSATAFHRVAVPLTCPV